MNRLEKVNYYLCKELKLDNEQDPDFEEIYNIIVNDIIPSSPNERILDYCVAYYLNVEDGSNIVKYGTKAAENGSGFAMYALWFHYNSQRDSKSKEKAKVYGIQAIEMGNETAINRVRFDNSNSKNKKYIDLTTHYKIAMDKGSVAAILKLASIEKDEKKAFEYYQLAIDKKSNEAMFELASNYRDKKDYVNAEKYYIMAIENGHYLAAEYLMDLYRINKKPKERTKVVEILKYCLENFKNGSCAEQLFDHYWLKKEHRTALYYYDICVYLTGDAPCGNSKETMIKIIKKLLNEDGNAMLDIVMDKLLPKDMVDIVGEYAYNREPKKKESKKIKKTNKPKKSKKDVQNQRIGILHLDDDYYEEPVEYITKPPHKNIIHDDTINEDSEESMDIEYVKTVKKSAKYRGVKD